MRNQNRPTALPARTYLGDSVTCPRAGSHPQGHATGTGRDMETVFTGRHPFEGPWEPTRCRHCHAWGLPLMARWADPAWLSRRWSSARRDYTFARENFIIDEMLLAYLPAPLRWAAIPVGTRLNRAAAA